MALPNRIGSYTFEHADGSIKLSATLAATDALEADVGQDWRPYIGTAGLDVVKRLTNIFYHFQQGTEYTKDEIFNWLSGDITEWEQPETVQKLNDMFATLNGVQYLKQFPKVDASKKKAQS